MTFTGAWIFLVNTGFPGHDRWHQEYYCPTTERKQTSGIFLMMSCSSLRSCGNPVFISLKDPWMTGYKIPVSLIIAAINKEEENQMAAINWDLSADARPVILWKVKDSQPMRSFSLKENKRISWFNGWELVLTFHRSQRLLCPDEDYSPAAQ